ncbi:enoyl-CoA hydratase/isomerase family protein [Arthrobacter crystallopoietes]|uniref:Enoyl-CoA hydratase/carnithine racemase n=1 Tax=Crystallibacter crystallopoietes TaxID=37928 RepID=A0A1H1CUY2_9MICC|nr:enoyl-CoA hydratase/isomerase family protein [Arthrobacter crystallopoietes]AUI50591.1 hypothetical protein AC20117_06875 [Arthrobacter crystallopoietes]SDQ68033.1 Enoyl-CoA hydratase/carnithine racemase [Arthrobacter crystallopoietes]
MPVNLEIVDDVAIVTLDDPESLNALDDRMTADTVMALEKVAADESVRALVLTGTGRAFSVGGKLPMLAEMTEEATGTDGRAVLEARMRSNARLVEILRSMPQMSIAAINGACVGAAIGWISACDLRVATSNAKFNTAFLSLGLSSDFGTTKLLADAVGQSTAADWLLRPRPVSAQEAFASGLVNEVVDTGILLQTALDWARIAVNFPTGVAALKSNLQDASKLPLGECLERETERFAHSLTAPETTAQIRNLSLRRE